MNCEMRNCNKSIQEGRFICVPAATRTQVGNKNVNLLLVICEECIVANTFQDRVMGGAKIIEPQVSNPQEGL